MSIYKNIGLDNIRKKKRINTFGDVCWFFRSFRQLYTHFNDKTNNISEMCY